MLKYIILILTLSGCYNLKKYSIPQFCWARVQCTDKTAPGVTNFRFLQENEKDGEMVMCIQTYSTVNFSGHSTKVCYPLQGKDVESESDCLPDYDQYLKPPTESCDYQKTIQ